MTRGTTYTSNLKIMFWNCRGYSWNKGLGLSDLACDRFGTLACLGNLSDSTLFDQLCPFRLFLLIQPFSIFLSNWIRLRTSWRLGFGRGVVDLVVFDCLLNRRFGLVGRPFYDQFVKVKWDLFADFHRLSRVGEYWVFIEPCCSGSITGSLDPIVDNRSPDRFHNWEIYSWVHGVPTWPIYP